MVSQNRTGSNTRGLVSLGLGLYSLVHVFVWNFAPVIRDRLVVGEQFSDLLPQIILQTEEVQKFRRRRGPSEELWWTQEEEDVHLHGAVHFTAVEHQVKEVQVVQRRLPRHVLPLLVQVLGGLERQNCRDDLRSLKHENLKINQTFRIQSNCFLLSTKVDQNQVRWRNCR